MTPALAFGSELWWRHRRGFMALGAYLAVAAAIKLYIVTRGLTITFDDDATFAFAVVVPLSCSVLYLMGVFTYGFSGDVSARASMYPARMFTLPVSNAALVGWPMAFGAAAILGLWAAMRAFAPWPSDAVVPSIWPATFGVALVWWTQAVMWLPYPLAGARLIAAALVLQGMDAVALLGLHFRWSEWVMVAITLPQIPVAYAVARYAVARARRGEVPGSSRGLQIRHRSLAALGMTAESLATTKAFRSAEDAQAWFEWRRHGRALPVWVAIVSPFLLLILWAAGTSTAIVITTLLGAMITPVVMAFFSGVTMARSGNDSDWFGLPAFSAVRPLTNAQLLAAKLRMTARSTLVAWAVVAIVTPIALAWSGTWPLARDFGLRIATIVGAPRAIALGVLLLVMCMLSTWRQLVQSLWVGLSGNERLIKGSMFASIVLASIAVPTAIWIIDSNRLGVAWSMIPLVLAGVVALKMGAATWVATRLVRRRTLSDGVLVGGAIAWTTTVLALFGVLTWLADTPHIPRYLLMLIAIATVPLARLAAATLAMQRNRHR